MWGERDGVGGRPGAAALPRELPLGGQRVPSGMGAMRRGWRGAARGGGLRRAQGPLPAHLQGETYQRQRGKHAVHQQTSHSFEAEGRPEGSGSPPKIRIK